VLASLALLLLRLASPTAVLRRAFLETVLELTCERAADEEIMVRAMIRASGIPGR